MEHSVPWFFLALVRISGAAVQAETQENSTAGTEKNHRIF